jgi:hypothetical protein
MYLVSCFGVIATGLESSIFREHMQLYCKFPQLYSILTPKYAELSHIYEEYENTRNVHFKLESSQENYRVGLDIGYVKINSKHSSINFSSYWHIFTKWH